MHNLVFPLRKYTIPYYSQKELPNAAIHIHFHPSLQDNPIQQSQLHESYQFRDPLPKYYHAIQQKRGKDFPPFLLFLLPEHISPIQSMYPEVRQKSWKI